MDQLIKIVIDQYFMDKRFDIVNHLIGFEPYLNNKYSWVNSMGDFGWGRIFHIILVVFALLVITVTYDFILLKYSIGYSIITLFIFLYAGAICSLIDKIFWGGSLDYINLSDLFIFDLKDVYISIFEVMLVVNAILHYRTIKNMNEKDVLKNFYSYIKIRFFHRQNDGGTHD
jgi:signal peptidase II